MTAHEAPAFTLTAAELRALVSSAVSDALAKDRPRALPKLLDRNGLADALGCSSSQVDKLRLRGMPCVRLGDSPRFELEACVEWLRGQK